MGIRLYVLSLIALVATACAGLASTPTPKMYSAGYQAIRITDANNRPIALDIWFPAEGVAEAEHNYGISKGSVAATTTIAGDHLPIILLSHGAMGAAVNYSWIAEVLARHGYVVLAYPTLASRRRSGPRPSIRRTSRTSEIARATSRRHSPASSRNLPMRAMSMRTAWACSGIRRAGRP